MVLRADILFRFYKNIHITQDKPLRNAHLMHLIAAKTVHPFIFEGFVSMNIWFLMQM